MSLAKVSLTKALHKWESRKLVSAESHMVTKKDTINQWPHPLTHEQRKAYKQGLLSLV